MTKYFNNYRKVLIDNDNGIIINTGQNLENFQDFVTFSIDDTKTEWVLTHNFNSTDIVVDVYEYLDDDIASTLIKATISPIDNNKIKVTLNTPIIGKVTIMFFGETYDFISPISPSITPTPSITRTLTPTPTISITPSVTVSSSITPTLSPSVTRSVTPTVTASSSLTPSITPSITVSTSVSPTITPTLTPTATQSMSLTPSPTPTMSFTPSVTPTISVTQTISFTPTSSVTPTISVTPSVTPSVSVTPSITVSQTISLTPTSSVTPSITHTPTFTPTLTPTAMASPTPSATPSITVSPSLSATPSVTSTPSVTPSISQSVTPSITLTPSVTPSLMTFTVHSDENSYSVQRKPTATTISPIIQSDDIPLGYSTVISYVPTDGTAINGENYTLSSGSGTITSSVKQFSIPITIDGTTTFDQTTKNFTIDLSTTSPNVTITDSNLPINITDPQVVEALVYGTTEEANNEIATFTPPGQDVIFNTWERVGLEAEANQWTTSTDSNNNVIVTNPANSTSNIGFISPDTYSRYVHQAILTLSETSTDDDYIGFIVAHSEADGANKSIVAYRSGGASGFTATCAGFDFCLAVVDHTNDTTQQIVPITGASFIVNTYPDPSTPCGLAWGSNACALQVTRDGNNITVKTTPFYTAGTTQPAYSSDVITIDLSTNPDLSDFVGPSAYGYGAYSQPNCAFENIVFTASTDQNKIYDLQANQVHTYDTTSNSWVLADGSVTTYVAVDNIIHNSDTGNAWYIENGTTFTPVTLT